MDILIKGKWINPPNKDDYLDIRLYGTGEVVVNGDLDREAVAIPVPEHGDLIDKQKLIKELEKAWNVDDDQDFCNKSVWRIIERESDVVLERTT